MKCLSEESLHTKEKKEKNNFGAKIQIGIWFDFLNGLDMHCIEKGT